jgi:hypothetical protein
MKAINYIFTVLFLGTSCISSAYAASGSSVIDVTFCFIASPTKIKQKDLPITFKVTAIGQSWMSQHGSGVIGTVQIPAKTDDYAANWELPNMFQPYCLPKPVRLENQCGTDCSTKDKQWAQFNLTASNGSVGNSMNFNIFVWGNTMGNYGLDAGDNIRIADFTKPVTARICHNQSNILACGSRASDSKIQSVKIFIEL